MDVRFMTRPFGVAALMLCVCTGSAHAQLTTSGAEFNAGYGRSTGQENRVVANYGLRDSDGNLVIVDGVVQGNVAAYSASSANASASASASAGGSFSGGVGSATSSAVGNNLTVITQGDFNTVIINSTQINNGDVTAGATASGGASNAE